jgi:hypothetical protein
MEKWDKVSAEMWVDLTPDEIRFSSLFDEIVFSKQGITYRSHTRDNAGPLRDLFAEMRQRFGQLRVLPPEVAN